MSIEILDDTQQTCIPILNELQDITLVIGDIIHVWKNNVYYLAPSSSPEARLIIEADISTRMITRSIPISIIPSDTRMSITSDNTTNTYEPWYIYKCDNSICLIDKLNKNAYSHHYTYDVNIYIKNTTTNEEYPPIHITNISRIYNIIDYADKLYIAVCDYNELRININGEHNITWHKIFVIDTLTNTIIHTIAALNDSIYKIDIIDEKLIACQNWFGPRKVIWNINNLSDDPQIITQSFISYAKYNNLHDTVIYPYNGWAGVNPNFIESDDYRIVNTLNTPMADSEFVDIINDKFYIGLERISHENNLNIYNLQNHQLVGRLPFNFTYFDFCKIRPYYISNNHIVFSTSNSVKIYKIEERHAAQRKNKYEYLIANLANKYSLPAHLVWEIKQIYGKELQDYKPFEIVDDKD